MHHRQRYSLSILLISAASALLSAGMGCTTPDNEPPEFVPPEVPPGDPNPPAAEDPKAYFASQVYPKLSGTCGSCHKQGGIGPAFLGTDAESAYAAIKANPALWQPARDSLLLLKGEHQGPALNTAAASVVSHWLDLVKPPAPDEPDLPPDPTTSGVDKLLQEFGDCMDFGDWQESGMSEYARTQTLDSGACGGCHFRGLGGTFLNYDRELTFEANREQPFILKLVTPSYDDDGTVVGLEAGDRLYSKEGGGQSCPEIDRDEFDTCHPELDFTIENQQRQRVSEFVSDTLRRVQRGGCVRR